MSDPWAGIQRMHGTRATPIEPWPQWLFTSLSTKEPVSGKRSSNHVVKPSLGMHIIQFANWEKFVGVDCCKEPPSVKSAKHSYSC